jgi:hypothetical protein
MWSFASRFEETLEESQNEREEEIIRKAHAVCNNKCSAEILVVFHHYDTKHMQFRKLANNKLDALLTYDPVWKDTPAAHSHHGFESRCGIENGQFNIEVKFSRTCDQEANFCTISILSSRS